MVPPIRCSFDELRRDSHWGHPFHSPLRSQPQVEPEHSCPPSCSAESRKLMQWEALNRSVWRSFFGILQVPFFKPKLCKSPTTPFATPPTRLPCAPTPSTGPHAGSLSCSSFRASTLYKEEQASFPQFPDGTVSAFFIENTTGGMCSVHHAFSHHFCSGFLSSVNIWSPCTRSRGKD